MILFYYFIWGGGVLEALEILGALLKPWGRAESFNSDNKFKRGSFFMCRWHNYFFALVLLTFLKKKHNCCSLCSGSLLQDQQSVCGHRQPGLYNQTMAYP